VVFAKLKEHVRFWRRAKEVIATFEINAEDQLYHPVPILPSGGGIAGPGYLVEQAHRDSYLTRQSLGQTMPALMPEIQETLCRRGEPGGEQRFAVALRADVVGCWR